jgi:hypothetical protein
MFEKFRDKALNLAEVGMSKAKEVGEIAKLNLAIASEEENIKKAYIEIGKLYYAAKALNPDPEYAEFCLKNGECKAKIDLNKAKIAQIKADDQTCSCCDAEAAPGVDAEVPPEEPADKQE